jgi:hypothetical protein
MDRIIGANTIDLGGGRRGFRGKDTVAGIPGTELTALWHNAIQEEFISFLEANGFIPSNADLTQFTQSVRLQKVNYVEVAGTANALTADLTPNLAAYVKGLPLRLKIAITNTGAMTLDVDGIGAVSLLRRDGTAMKPGDAVAGQILTFILGAGNAFYCSSLLASDLVTAAPSAGRTQVFTASGSFVAPATQVEVWGIGAGGAGGASGDGSGGGVAGNMGAGGGAGGFGYKRVSGLVVGSTIAATVGAGGVPSTGGAAGNGGSTSFGPHMTCGGGGGGSYGVSTVGNGGSGGTVTGADVSVSGGSGGFSGPNSSSTVSPSDIIRIYGRGGMVAGGWGTATWGGTGGAGQGYGSGGSGASGGSLFLGGAGAPGLLIVRW